MHTGEHISYVSFMIILNNKYVFAALCKCAYINAFENKKFIIISQCIVKPKQPSPPPL